MVEHYLGAHECQELIECLGGEALEESVRLAAGTHAVDYLAAVVPCVNHCVHGVYVVLTVAVDADGHIALVLCFHQTCQHGVLMAPVAALADSDKMLVLFCQFADYIPGIVAAAVVHEHDAAVFRYPAVFYQLLQFFEKLRGGQRQHFLLIIAGNHHIKYSVFFHFFTSGLYRFSSTICWTVFQILCFWLIRTQML